MLRKAADLSILAHIVLQFLHKVLTRLCGIAAIIDVLDGLSDVQVVSLTHLEICYLL